MRHSKVKYPINITMYRNQLFSQFSTCFLSSIEGGLIEDDVCFLCETSVCLLECKVRFPFGTVMGKSHVPIHKGTFIAVNSFSCQFWHQGLGLLFSVPLLNLKQYESVVQVQMLISIHVALLICFGNGFVKLDSYHQDLTDFCGQSSQTPNWRIKSGKKNIKWKKNKPKIKAIHFSRDWV